MAEVFEFTWRVPRDGFRWTRVKAVDEEQERDYLTEGRPIGVGGMVKQYPPLKAYTGLFRTFADTAPTKEGILAFAETYGLLGEEQKLIAVPHEGGGALAPGEPLSLWLKEISAMCQAVELWDAVCRGDREALARRLAWRDTEGGPGVLYRAQRDGLPGDLCGVESEWIAAPEIHPERLERFTPGDLAMPALYRVQGVVNRHLKGRVSPRLLWDETRARLGLYIVPSSLVGALWLQFARAIDGQRGYRRCEECGRWFEVSPEVARSNRIYCSNACRSRAYRKRQEAARQMYAEGKTIGEIADAFGAEETVIQGWVEGGKSDGRLG